MNIQYSIVNVQSIQGTHMASDQQPQILAFVCNWCAYAGADLAGVSRIQYPSNVRLIRLMCTGRVNHGFLLKAFLKGADGLMVSG
jgi:F420-non-reducing hydrogenase iron-sulfur subunit